MISDTQQLRWYTAPEKDGVVTVDTPRSQALIGFVKAQNQSVTNLSARVDNSFCTLLLSSMDEQPISSSAKLLFVAGGTVQNTGQTWNSAGTDVTTFGGPPPTLIDNVRGSSLLRGIQGARAVQVQAIDGADQPLGNPVHATKAGADWSIPLGAVPTTWYEITVAR